MGKSEAQRRADRRTRKQIASAEKILKAADVIELESTVKDVIEFLQQFGETTPCAISCEGNEVGFTVNHWLARRHTETYALNRVREESHNAE